MPTRREFMRHATVTSMWRSVLRPPDAVLAGLRREEAPRDGSRDEPHEFFRVLFDNTSAEGEAFGAEAAARGASTRAVGIDLGSIWMHEIEPRWDQGPIAVAGLTHGAALFCLELLARDFRMGVVYRVRHDLNTDGRCRHSLTGPKQLSSWPDHLATAGRGWAGLSAALAMSCPSALSPGRDLDLVDLGGCSALAERSLFSWVIAAADGAPALAGRT